MSIISDAGAFISSDKFGDTVQGIANTVGGITDTLKSVGIVKTTKTGSQVSQQVQANVNTALNDFTAGFVGNKLKTYALPIAVGLGVILIVWFAGKKSA